VAGELAVRGLAAVRPRVHYLATGRVRAADTRRFASLEAYLASRDEHVVPHRPWFNYWNNALGLNDEEFSAARPPGRLRVLAVGDSFTFGLVPYPDTVTTLLEAGLRAACAGRDLEVLNFGIGGTGVRDYRTLVELADPAYRPDVVLVNVYAGNDPPNLRDAERGAWRRRLGQPYLWRLGRNVWTLYRDVPEARTIAAAAHGVAPPGGAAGQARGGTVVAPGGHVPPDDVALVGPIFEEGAFDGMLAAELGRLHVPRDASEIERLWRPLLADLEAVRVLVAGRGGRLAITLYPSQLQIDTRLRAALVDRLRRGPAFAGLTPDAVDPGLPARVLGAHCGAHGVHCLDLTAGLARAAAESPVPLYKARDTHWTVHGNRVAAEAQARDLAPLVCPAVASGGGGLARPPASALSSEHRARPSHPPR
jgi:lysophospholipase L1-like esterase